jgi:hypothetical protein
MADTVPGDDTSTVTVAVNGAALLGEIETVGDQDWYRVAMTANVPYTIRMVGLGTSSYSLADPLIEGIYSSSGYVSGFNNDGLISGPYGRDAMTTFTPTTTANYWVATAGDMRTIGTFQIFVTSGAPVASVDTVLASTLTASTVAVGGAAVSGLIDNVTDVDWYKAALIAGTSYTFRVRGSPSGSGTLADPVITGLYDSAGAYIANTYVDDFGTRDAALTLTAPYTGNYYIGADGWNTYTGTFLVDVAVATTDIPGDSSSTTTLAIGAATTVSIGRPYDHDWYKVALTAGITYQYSMSGTGSNNTPGIHGVFNSAGNYLGGYTAAILGPSSATTGAIFVPAVSGDYFIDAYSLYEGTYTLSVNQVASDVPNNLSTTATVAVGGFVTGDIGGATDIDWFSVSLLAGNTYTIKMQGQQSGNGTLADTIIAGIYNASGVLIANTFNDDADGNEALLTFSPASNGTYYIAADGYAGYAGTYKLSVAAIVGDVGQTMATAESMTLNTPKIVTIDNASDVDWYSIVLAAGSTYGIRLHGAPTKRGTLSDPVLLNIYDSTGTPVAGSYVDDTGVLLDPKWLFTPAVGGTYYVAVDGYDRFTGTMKLAATIDNNNNTNAQAVTFSVASPAEGTIDFGVDVDRYKITLAASETYYIRMMGLTSRNGDLVDPMISAMYQSNGTTAQAFTRIGVTPFNPTVGLDDWIVVQPTIAGDYYLALAQGGAASDEGDFLLTVEKDIPGGTTTTATVTVGVPVTGLIGDVGDVDWYKVTLSVNNSYVVKMLGFDSGNGTLDNPNINGIRLSTTSGTIISGTSGTAVDNAVFRDSVARLIPAANGDYYIAAQSSASEMGSFVLSVDIEAGNTNATAWTFAVGNPVTGTIDDTPDIDWYKISLTANTNYVFKMLGVDSGAGTLDDPLISGIRNATTAMTGLITSSVGMDSVVRWRPTTTGDYYIAAQGAGTDNGTFVLSAQLEVGATVADAGSVAVGGSVTGTIDDGTDADWYKVALNSNTAYLFRMSGKDSGGGTLVDTYIPSILNGSAVAQAGVQTNAVGSDTVVLWQPAVSGDYYINAQSQLGKAGTFLLSVETEVGSTAATAGSLAVGGSVTGTIDGGNDADWYKVALTANTTYVFRMSGVESGGGTLINTYIPSIHNGSGVAQAGLLTTAVGTDTVALWTPTVSGDYYINAQSQSGAVGTFRLTAEMDVGSTAASAGLLAVGGSVTGSIDSATDADWYKITLNANTSYVFRMLGVDSGGGTLADTYIPSIHDGSGAVQAGFQTDAFGTDTYARWSPTVTGDYYINAQSQSGAIGSFRLTAETEVGSTVASAASITVGGSVTGSIDGGTDVDWYKVTLNANTAYLFKMLGVDGGGGTLADTYIPSIHDGSGAVQAGFQTDAVGTDTFARWVPAVGGDYYINAQSQLGKAGTFRLVVETEVGSTAATAGSITVGGSVNGSIDGGTDADWYKVTLNANTAYLFKMLGTDSGGGTLIDTYIPSIVDGSGAAQAGVQTNAVGTDTVVRWAPTVSGDYYINAQSQLGKSGTFGLTVGTEVGSTAATAGSIAAGGSVAGTIDDGADADWYKITVSNTNGYLFKMSGTDSGGGTLTDTYIAAVRDAAGVAQVIKFDTNAAGSDTYAHWSPATSGDYYIDVQSQSGARGTFSLTAETEIGTTALSAGSITVGGSVSGTINDPYDADWYKISLSGTSSYLFKMTGADSGAGTLGDPNIFEMLDSAGAAVAGEVFSSVGNDSIVRFTGATGDYYINAQGAGTIGTFLLSAETEVGSTAATAGSLAVGGSVSGKIDDASDADWYSIALTAGTRYVFNMSGTASGGGTLGDPNIPEIRTAAGAAVTTETFDTFGTDSIVYYTPTISANYFIDAQGAGTTGTFLLKAGIDVGDTTATTGLITVGGAAVSGTIDSAGDDDWYKVALLNTKSYIFTMTGVTSGDGTLGDPNIAQILNSTPTAQTIFSSASGPDSIVRFAPGSSTNYFINAQGAGTIGTFLLNAATEAGQTTATAQAITVGAANFVNGAIDDGADIDWYSVTLAANTRYRVRMEGADSGNGTLADPYISSVRTSGGTVITTSTGSTTADGGGTGKDAYAIFTNSNAGTYYIYADNSTTAPAIIGTYKLTVELWP